MRNIIGQAVTGDDLYGREYELAQLWERFDQDEHLLMLAPRRVGKTSLMLELRRAPRESWDVLYVDVEGGEGPADCVAAILAGLAAKSEYRTGLRTVRFSQAVRNILENLSVRVEVDPLHVELKSAIGREWNRAADQLRAGLAGLSGGGHRLLIIIDELPILVSRILRAGGQERDVELLLSWLRQMRQEPELRGRICTLVGGSIGLEGILRRAGHSGLISDLAPFRLASWDRVTAATFMETLGKDCDFVPDGNSIGRILDLLGDPVPYHVQLFFSALRDACRGDSGRISEETIDRCFADRLAGASGTAHLDHYVTRLETALDEHEYDVAVGILGNASRRRNGATPAELTELMHRDEQTFRSVLQDLEADGYLTREGDRLEFRSNLLREWWRKHHSRTPGP